LFAVRPTNFVPTTVNGEFVLRLIDLDRSRGTSDSSDGAAYSRYVQYADSGADGKRMNCQQQDLRQLGIAIIHVLRPGNISPRGFNIACERALVAAKVIPANMNLTTGNVKEPDQAHLQHIGRVCEVVMPLLQGEHKLARMWVCVCVCVLCLLVYVLVYVFVSVFFLVCVSSLSSRTDVFFIREQD
jgi:hypothetical protein